MNLITKKLKLTKKTLFLYKNEGKSKQRATDLPADPITTMIGTNLPTLFPIN